MTKQKTTKKTLLTSVLSLVLCMAMLIGTTFAWFTDSVSSTNNIIKSGNLDVNLYYWDNSMSAGTNVSIQEQPDTKLFKNVDGEDILWEPGATGFGQFEVANEGSLALKYQLKLNFYNATETAPGSGKTLADVLSVYAVARNGNTGSDEVMEDDNLESLRTNGIDSYVPGYEAQPLTDFMLEGYLLPGESFRYELGAFWEPTASDNDYNVAGGLSIDFGVTLLATQMTYEEDSYDDQYDKNADYDGEISTENALNAALTNGGTYKVLNNITVSGNKSMEVPAGVEVVLDMGDKAITGNVVKSDGAALIKNNGTLTIKNGSISNGTVNGSATIANNGTMVLDGVAVTGAPINSNGYPEYTITSTGSLTIEDGTTVTSDRGGLRLSGTGTTVINGGTFINNDLGDLNLTSHVVYIEPDSNNKLTINGGIFKHLHSTTSGGVVINNSSTGTVYVNGGNFSGGNYFGQWDNLADYGYGGTFVVTGGTYTGFYDKYLANGYTSVKNVDDTISVVQGVKVSNSTELTNAVRNGATNVYLVDGEYDVTNCYTEELTINGSTNAVLKISNEGEDGMDYGFDGQYVAGGISKVTFNGVTINTTNNSGQYRGFARMQGTYNDCTFVGAYCLGAGTNVFNGCTFNFKNNYIWTWGASKVVFNNCTFEDENGVAKAILVHNTTDTEVTVKDCKFIATTGAKTWDKIPVAAVSIDPNGAHTVNVNFEGNNTVADAFHGLHQVKYADEIELITVKVDGAEVNVPVGENDKVND